MPPMAERFCSNVMAVVPSVPEASGSKRAPNAMQWRITDFVGVAKPGPLIVSVVWAQILVATLIAS